MSCEFNREQLAPGVGFSRIWDPKFKQNRISACLILPLEKQTVTQRALLPFLLRKGTKNCPDFTQLNRRLSQLYGAMLDADVSKYGAYQVLCLTIQAVDDRFALEKEDIAQQCAALLCEILLQPNLENGEFPRQDVQLEREFLVDTIQSEINDKRSYAVSQCTQSLFEGTPFAVKKYGYADAAKAITPQSAAQEYRKVLDSAAVEILFTGSGTAEGARRVFAQAFSRMDRHPVACVPAPVAPVRHQGYEFSEQMDVRQGKLVLGFRIAGELTRRQKDATRMMCALFGGTPFSKLFLNVREKLSLCYYCAARYDRSSGALLVDSGVEFANRQSAQKEILAQLDAICRGEFTDEELGQTLLAMKNSLRTIGDSLGATESWYLTQILSGGDVISAQQDIENLQELGREDLIEAAQRLQLDSVYFLTGKSGEENAQPTQGV